jgi:transcriptional regulator with XRE-family HTH domain
MELLKHVGNRIRELRQKAGESQEELAAALKVAANTISRWETATYKPSLEDLDKLARHFRVSILEFFPQSQSQPDSKVEALLRVAQDLKPEDVDELKKYAEFRRAQALYQVGSRRTRGRKRGEQK